ncbi:MAG: melibiose:sodium transporter MelB [Fusobacteriaceae bacterium]
MLSNRLKLSYGIGALGKDLACSIVYIFLMYYYTDVIGVAPAFAGTLFLVARMWDAFNDPAMGMIVDNTRSKFGKFRPWILVGTILNSIALIALFTKPSGLSGNSLYIYTSIVYILWGMTYTVMDIPYWSMIPSLAKSKKDREQIAVIPRIFASCAWLIMGSFGLSIIGFLGKGDSIKGFSVFAIGIAVVFILSEILVFFNVREQIPVKNKTEKIDLKSAFRMILKNDQLVALIGTILVFNLMVQLSGGVAIYYFKYVVGKEKLFSIFTGVSGLAEMGGLLLFPIMASKFGREKLYFLACALPIIGFSCLFMAGAIIPESIMAVAFSGIIARIGTGFTLGLSTVMLADVVDYGEYKFGTRNESVVFSVQTLLVKSASALSGWLIGTGLSLVGYVANMEQSPATITGLKVLMIFIPIGLSVVGYIVYKKFYNLHGEYYDGIMEKIKFKNSLGNLPEHVEV